MSKKDVKKRKLNNFKNKAKKMAEQKKTPKTHLIPQTEWQSNDVLEIRGDVLEALEKTLVSTFENLQRANAEFGKAGQVMQMILAANIKAGKVTLKYKWNNGEEASEQDVADYQAKMQQLQAQQKAQYEQLVAQQKQSENALKSGLVDTNGVPIGSDQDLDGESDGQPGVETTEESKNAE